LRVKIYLHEREQERYIKELVGTFPQVLHLCTGNPFLALLTLSIFRGFLCISCSRISSGGGGGGGVGSRGGGGGGAATGGGINTGSGSLLGSNAGSSTSSGEG